MIRSAIHFNKRKYMGYYHSTAFTCVMTYSVVCIIYLLHSSVLKRLGLITKDLTKTKAQNLKIYIKAIKSGNVGVSYIIPPK